MAVELFDAIEPDRIRNFGNVAYAIFGGRMNYSFDNTSGFTWEYAMRVAAKPFAVAPIFGQSASATPASPAFLAVVKCVPSLDEVETYGSWTTCTFGGSGTSTLTAAASVTRRKLVIADLAQVSGVEPTDGGDGWWVVVRCWVNGGNALELLGDSGDSFNNWSSRDGLRQVRIRRRVGPGNDTTSTGKGWDPASYSPVVGIKYAALHPVVTVAAIGDSISDGRGTYKGAGPVLLACEELTAQGSVAVECANLAWSGASSVNYRVLLQDAFTDGVRADVVVMPAGTPNDVTTTITSDIVGGWNTGLAVMQSYCRDYGAEPLVWTMLPSNASVKAYGATDSLRTDHNASVLALRQAGRYVADAAALFNGATTGGQIEMNPDYEDDGIHPNDAGNAVMAPVISEGVERIARGLLKAV